MKQFILPAVAGLLLTACNPVAYQVIETRPAQLPVKEGKPVYEDKEVEVSYDFWNGSQQITFEFYNKTNQALYLDLTRTHLIVNAQSFDYYSDGQDVSSGSAGNPNSGTGYKKSRQAAKTVFPGMKKVVEVPPLSLVSISGVQIIRDRILDCELQTVTNQPVSKIYSPDNSPLIFRNYITYGNTPDVSKTKVLDNTFFAETIWVMDEAGFQGKILYPKTCPTDKKGTATPAFPFKRAQNIYLKF